MNNTQHTPGPWKHQKPRGHQHAIDRKWEIVQPLPGGGEMVVVGEHTGVDCLTEVNARLIAASPDLLDALRALLNGLAVGAFNRKGRNCQDLLDMAGIARAAIARATGGTP